MRRARAGALPGVTSTRQHVALDNAFFGEDSLERRQPVLVVSLTGVGIAGRLRFLDFVAKRRRPFGPGEQAALLERYSEREGFRFPRRAKQRAVLVARDPELVIPARFVISAEPTRGCQIRTHAGSR